MAGGPSTEHPIAAEWPGVEIVPASAIDLIERRLGVPAPLWSTRSLKQLWRQVGACDVVHVHDYLYAPSLGALFFAACRGRPTVLTQHVGDIPFPSSFARGLLSTLNHVLGRWVLGHVDQVVFVGRPVLEYFDRFVRWRHVPQLIPNGVDRARYRDENDPPGRDAACDTLPLRALFVGRFVDKKGLPLLRECMDVSGIAWTFVGRGPLSPAAWPESARAAVRLTGLLPPDAVAREMRTADLLVLPSRGEGFPLVVQEALACGTPVLTSRDVFDAFPQTDPRCVFAVDIEGADAVDRLREALRARTAALASLRAARADAVALAGQWSWERCAETYHAIYSRLRAGA
jgi:glycosyltransferase involved in cell wall biosynthesis